MVRVALASIGLFLLASGPLAAADAGSGVAKSRLEKLTMGINLSHWFAQSDVSPRTLATYDTPADFALIKSLGFRHVRWTFKEQTVLDGQTPGVLDAAKMKVFDNALDQMLAAGLAVIVDYHPESDAKQRVARDDKGADDYIAMWKALARHLAGRDPERVFLETMNEPEAGDARWNVVQPKVLAAMREAAPKHTLVASGGQWSGVGNLLKVTPVDDKNVVYNFHCYDPFIFTHQGASWAGPVQAALKNVPYPPSPEAIEKVLPDIANDAAKRNLTQYGKESWGMARFESIFGAAVAWAAKHGVALTCNEFGVFRNAAAPDRCRCIADARTALEKHGIGWCMWDYAGGFSVATGGPGNRKADPETVKALGLKMPN